jgi:hypothetical protein
MSLCELCVLVKRKGSLCPEVVSGNLFHINPYPANVYKMVGYYQC